MFHVPELGRVLNHPFLGSTSADGNNGAFDIESSEPGWRLSLICSDSSGAEFLCSDGDGTTGARWEHVSVHAYRYQGAQTRTPTWGEMCYVKRLCWDDDDVVMQLHPRKSEYVNNHPNVLHLWRPLEAKIPEPPSIYVGIKERT